MENNKMLDKSNHNNGCGFADQILFYLYNEIGGPERYDFETHLKVCPLCEGELQGFTSVRASIQEWRAEEFTSLSAPVFVRPALEKPLAVSRSPFETIRKFFTVSPFWAPAAGAAFVALTVFAGVFWYSSNPPTDRNNIAEHHEETVKEAVAPLNKEAAPTDLTSLASNQERQATMDSTPKTRLDLTTKGAINETGNIVTRQVKTGSPLGDISPVHNTKLKRSTLAKPGKNNKINAPRLNKNAVPPLLIEEDDDDDSLRLSDILEEVSLK